MRLNSSRAGIERKILTSILWVGILPMAVAFIVGYVTARSGQTKAVQQTLLASVDTTAEGIRLLVEERLQRASNLASDPLVLDVMAPDSSGVPRAAISDEQAATLLPLLRHRGANPGDAASVISIYTESGHLLVSSDAPLARGQLPPEWLETLDRARIVEFGQVPIGESRFSSLIVCPITLPGTGGKIVGYLGLQSGVSTLLRYAMGEYGGPGEAGRRIDHYQYLVKLPTGADVIAYFEWPSNGASPEIRLVTAVDPRLREKMASGAPGGAFSLSDYRSRGPGSEVDVLMAYRTIEDAGSDDLKVCLLVYRPTDKVYYDLNLGASLGLLGCVVFIAFLCVNAYRDVHNNIVRPVSLLNEGAQIIRQGDFDLKLKIGTGDEIEELATSFNKMAVALKRNIRQLEESEENYRSLVTSMRDGIYQTDKHGAITFINLAGAEILGFPSIEEAMGKNLRQLFQEEFETGPFSEGFDGGEMGERSRVWMRRLDDRRICVELSRTPVMSPDAELLGVEGIFRDVTKNVRLEQEARERSERISAINQIANVINSSLEAGRLYESLVAELKKLLDFDYAAVALMSERGTAFDGRQLWPEDERGLGYTFSLDAQGSCSGWVARERRCLLVEDLKAGLSPFAHEFPPDAKSCLCVPLYATGRIIGTLNLASNDPAAYSIHDVEVIEQMAPHLAVAIRNAQLLVNLQLSLEEVTRAREKLHEANEELKTLDELKTNLLSNVSHELRTPLVSVMGYSDMIINGKAGPINNTQREYLAISMRNIEKLVTLIENLLDFSRLHRGDERLVFDTFDLVDCARGSIQIVKPVSDSRNIAIELDADEEPILVEGDKGKLGQVFNNLLSNALKFNDNGGRVDVSLKLGSGWVDVSVVDTGIGIPPEAIQKVFTRFYQYDGSSTRKYGGTGIGLSIAQDIMRLHGSSIGVTSEVGKGSAFRFRMNLAGGRRVTGEPGELPHPEDTHVLIELVSNDRALGIQIRSVITAEGMDLIHASTLDHATNLALKYSPDCIVVDMDSGEDGRSLIEEVLKNTYTGSLPIVLMTNDDALYEQYRPLVSARVRRSFRKSSLLSGIQHALSQQLNLGDPVGDKILCVDDDSEILGFMRSCLGAEGFAVDTCSSGEEGLKMAEGREYGLILLDIAMPGMDGWEMCRRIKADPELSRIKVYMVTAKPIDQNKTRLQECGADGFLLKPFRPEDLVQLVQGLEIRTVAQ